MQLNTAEYVLLYTLLNGPESADSFTLRSLVTSLQQYCSHAYTPSSTSTPPTTSTHSTPALLPPAHAGHQAFGHQTHLCYDAELPLPPARLCHDTEPPFPHTGHVGRACGRGTAGSASPKSVCSHERRFVSPPIPILSLPPAVLLTCSLARAIRT